MKIKVGEIDIQLPEPPKDKTKILNFDLAKKDQKWRRTETPLHLLSPKEGYIYTEEDRNFIKQEWQKCKEGTWFYNNGNLEYITGHHYFYCNYWQIDVGYAMWTEADRDFFYFWDHCVKSPNCLGMCFIANRRSGKTFKSTSIAYLRTIFQKNAHAGIQSKTSSDAKQVFSKLILSWKKLPEFFRPTDEGIKTPKTTLNFSEPSTKQSKGQKKIYKNVLDSWIDYGATVETFYDGSKLQTYILDEFGKFLEANPHEMLNIVRECLLVGVNVVGKACLITTVEEMEKKGGLHAKKIWDESDPNDIQPNGRTRSGLFRLFKEAYHGLEGYIDEYGYSKREEAEQAIRVNRMSMKGESLASEIRKHPLEPSEAFLIDKGSVFDLVSIHVQKDYNKTIPSQVVRGNLVWAEEDKQVRWMPQENGKWLIYQLPPADRANNFIIRSGKMSPGNNDLFVAGADPIDQSKVYHNHESKAACHVFRLKDPFKEEGTHCFVAEYVARPPKTEIFYEDMIMTAVYYGTELLVERNRPGLIEYVRQRGFERYLTTNPYADPKSKQIEYGISMTGVANRDALVRAVQTYIYDYCGWIDDENRNGEIFFDELLQDWEMFDVEAWTKYDRTVSSGLALLAAGKNFIKKNKEKPVRYIPVRTYNKKKFTF